MYGYDRADGGISVKVEALLNLIGFQMTKRLKRRCIARFLG